MTYTNIIINRGEEGVLSWDLSHRTHYLMMKKLLLFIVISALSLIVLAGCNIDISRQGVSADEFTQILSDKDYQVSDISDQIDDETIESATIAVSDNLQLKLYVFSSNKDAKEFYEDMFELLYQIKESLNVKYSSTKLDIFAYQHYSLFSNEADYYMISLVKNTVLYSTGSSECKDTIKEIFKELDY